MRYYIFSFIDDNHGKGMRNLLSGSPNGTVFNQGPLHVNSKGNVWVVYSNSKNIEAINDSIEWLKSSNSVEIIPTDITEVIIIPRNVKSRDDKEFNLKMVNIFCSFAPDIDLT